MVRLGKRHAAQDERERHPHRARNAYDRACQGEGAKSLEAVMHDMLLLNRRNRRRLVTEAGQAGKPAGGARSGDERAPVAVTRMSVRVSEGSPGHIRSE